MAWRLNLGCGSQAQDTAFTALHASQDALNAFTHAVAHSGTDVEGNDNGARLPLSSMETGLHGLPLSDKTRNQIKQA